MPSSAATSLNPGDLVHVRSRHYLVEAVEVPETPQESTLVHLSCLDDDAQGAPLSVLWEHEIDARPLNDVDWSAVATRGFDSPTLFSAYMHTLRWNCVTATDASLFQAPYRAGIEVKSYQLEPLRMALNMPRVKLFIADDVGLGKTIEAGLILRELLMRQKVRQCLIAVPPSVVQQWKEEMEERFGLTFVIYDREFVTRMRQQRGYAVNPFSTHTRFIISHALLRDEAYASSLREWLGEFAPKSLLILDEAHHVAPSSGSKYAIDSQLTRAMRDLSPRFEHKLFLSATPHNGHSNSFSALLEILDPQKFCRGVPVTASTRDTVMVRRLKNDLRAIGEPFPDRQILRLDLHGLPEDAPELVLSNLLQEYRKLREMRLSKAPKSVQRSAMLVMISLQKRLLSSIKAFSRTLRVHQRAVQRQADAHAVAPPAERDLELLQHAPDADDERAALSEELVNAEEEVQMTRASRTGGAPSSEELALLEKMKQIATSVSDDPDPRIRFLEDWIRKNLCPDLGKPDAQWLPRRVLIFTEYADTKDYIAQQLAAIIATTDQADDRIATYHGGIDDARREQIKSAFNADPARHPLRILIATDAAREGVNLQNHCADLFHFDIPWNPGRLEQRNGRIDRKLQRAPVVSCHYFVFPQRPEDRVLDVLVQKTETIHQELGSLSPVLARRFEEVFERGISHVEADALESQLAQVTPDMDALDDADALTLTTADDATFKVRTIMVEMGQERSEKRRKKLNDNIDNLRVLLDKSRDFIGLDANHFRAALSASLDTLGAPALERDERDVHRDDPERSRYLVPPLHERFSKDASWAATLDALRAPRKPNQKLAEWRRTAPMRPVVFRDPGNLDGEVVHLHLEHRVVQRLLNRFLAQGFQQDVLRRACVLGTDESHPHVILLGRLSLFGEGGARLHDELLAVSARWTDPSQRPQKGDGLPSLNEGEKKDVLRELEHAFQTPRLLDVSPGVRERFAQSAPRDVEILTDRLTKRAQELIQRAEKKLVHRGEAEAKEMITILENQKKHIEKREAEVIQKSQQLTLDFDPHEKRQLELDRKHWRARLDQIDRELAHEPQAIREHYAVRAHRIEPVGLVYLWPTSS